MDHSIPVLELNRVTVVRGKKNEKILNAVSLKITTGENVAILGPNGAGKTSLVKIITREYYPLAQKGSCSRFRGQDRWNIFDLRNLIGVVTNHLQSDCARDISGMETVLSGFFSSIGLHREKITTRMTEKAVEVMRFLEIEHLKGRSMTVMSSGESRRFLIARALIHDPKLLLLDEPTNSLDLRSALLFKKILRKIAKAGTNVILVTQHLPDIIPEITRVILMKDGKIVKDGHKGEVLTRRNMRALFGVPIDLKKHKGFYYTLG